MRRALVWTLAATVVASLGALWGTDGRTMHIVQAVDFHQIESFVNGATVPIANARTVKEVPYQLPAELPPVKIDPAKQDIFIRYTPPPPAAPPPSVVGQFQPAEPLPPPPLQAPALNLRFLGMMVTPAGQRLVYLARGEAILPIAVGDRLDEGYVVTALAADAVTLNFPPLDARVIVPITQPPQQ